MTDRSLTVLLTGMAIALTVSACTVPSIRPEPIRLSGSWSLLNSLSELPVTDRDGRTVLPNAWESGALTASTRAALRRAVEPPRRLDIIESDSALTVSAGDEQRLVLHRNGRAYLGLVSGAACECRANWDGAALVVEYFVGGHTHVIETYETLDNPKRLAVTVIFDDDRLARPLTSSRLYQAADVFAHSVDPGP